MKAFNLKGHIFRKLRQVWQWWPERSAVKKAALNPSTGLYVCSQCNSEVVRREAHVDHLEPVIDPAHGFIDWNTYIERLFTPASNLRVLCKGCHSAKTKEENKRRREVRQRKARLVDGKLGTRRTARVRKNVRSPKVQSK